MELRFQKEDELDRQVKEEMGKFKWLLIFFGVLSAVIWGISFFFTSDSFKDYCKILGWQILVLLLLWLIASVYSQFYCRIKEMDGKISAIESTVNESKEHHSELLEKLSTIEDKLTRG